MILLGGVLGCAALLLYPAVLFGVPQWLCKGAPRYAPNDFLHYYPQHRLIPLLHRVFAAVTLIYAMPISLLIGMHARPPQGYAAALLSLSGILLLGQGVFVWRSAICPVYGVLLRNHDHQRYIVPAEFQRIARLYGLCGAGLLLGGVVLAI